MKKYVLLFTLSAMFIIPANSSIAAEKSSCKPIKQVFHHAKADHGVCRVEVERHLPKMVLEGKSISPELMELSFTASFEKIAGETVATGEFALMANEVNPVIDVLREGHLKISALHNHMIGETPRILFLHFQGTGDANQMANTVKKAIETAKQK